MDPMLYALVNSQDTGRAVREEFYSLKFDLKVTDLSEINNPFVIFKNKDCVNESIEEIELVKQKLMNAEKISITGIEDWEV